MGKITLAVEMGTPLLTTRHFMEFLMVDHRFAYHGVLGRPALKELWAVTSIHHLRMKFPIKQVSSRFGAIKWDLGSVTSILCKKVEPWSVNVILWISKCSMP